jgi:hypothetical protein
MTVIARRWIVSTGELWLPDGSPTSKPDPETEDWVVLAEDYDALADQLRGAVDTALRDVLEEAKRRTPQLTGDQLTGDRIAMTIGYVVIDRLRGQ